MGDVRVWNERYGRGEHASSGPSPFISEVVESLPAGRALDVACGAGRHTTLLAARGWQVIAIDGSEVAIDLLRSRLEESWKPRVTTIVRDLEVDPPAIDAGAFDLVVVSHYLNRALIPALRAAVRPSGHIAMAVHWDPAATSAKLAARGELRRFFSDWEIAIDRERENDDEPGVRHRHGTAELFARRPT